MSSTLKFIREDLIGGALGKVDSVLPEMGFFQLQNTTFTKLAILVGLAAAVKGTFCALTWLKSRITRPPRYSKDKTALTKRYGEKSWAVVDIYRNENYATELAAAGFNIILVGSKERVEIGSDLVRSRNPAVEVEEFIVDWEQDQLNESVYKALADRFQYYDISVLVTPKVHSVPVQPFEEKSQYPAVMPVFLLISTFLKKLKSRAYRSAIIVNSDSRSGKVENGRSLENAAVSAVESLATTLEYEVRDFCDLVIAKGTEIGAFDSLGFELISTD